MDKKALSYLSLLEEDNSEKRLDHLRDIFMEEESVEILENADPEQDLEIPQVGYLRFRDHCSEEERLFFQWIARQLHRKQVQKRDELTGLISRSYWERELKHVAEETSWSVAMADIDHFKRFNDDYGHDMGDRVLEAVGQEVTGDLESEGYCVRYGGEEILIVLDLEFRRFERKMDRFRERLASSQLFAEQPKKISISVGIAEHKANSELDQSIKEADLALYESKESGRNRLTRYAPYLDYSNRLYVWGIFRYLWSATVRFVLDHDRLAFLLYCDGYLRWYEWGKNRAVNCDIPGGVQQPVRSLGVDLKGFLLLDNDGELWRHILGQNFEKLSTDDDPTIVELAGRAHTLRAIGINNQLYSIREEKLERELGLPERWDQLIAANNIYITVENILTRWTEQGCVESWPLPEPARQLTASGDSLFMIGQSGRLFPFKPSINRWEQVQFMNLVGNWVPCREVSAQDQQMAVLDQHGRLLLVRGDGSHTKAVPQEMNLNIPT